MNNPRDSGIPTRFPIDPIGAGVVPYLPCTAVDFSGTRRRNTYRSVNFSSEARQAEDMDESTKPDGGDVVVF